MSADRAGRLARLRARLAERGVDGLFLPRTDEHGSEYLPASAERVAWLTGFTGSAAQVVVLRGKAAVFTDGRYTVQVAQEVDEALFERPHVVSDPPAKWIEASLPEGARLGFDPFLVTRGQRDRIAKAVEARGGSLVPLDPDPVGEVWADRPAPPVSRVVALGESFTGEASAAKRARLGDAVAAKGADRRSRPPVTGAGRRGQGILRDLLVGLVRARIGGPIAPEDGSAGGGQVFDDGRAG